MDEQRLAEVRQSLECANDYSGVRLLDDLCDPDTDLTWMWRLGGGGADAVPAQDFADVIRLRLGAAIADSPFECRLCGHISSVHGRHALCCATGQATVGHNRIRDIGFKLAVLGDASATVETPGLIASRPELRPADLLTSAAVQGGRAALDFGVASPESTGAGADACQFMV